jgi:hypothetical protein
MLRFSPEGPVSEKASTDADAYSKLTSAVRDNLSRFNTLAELPKAALNVLASALVKRVSEVDPVVRPEEPKLKLW